MVDFHDRRDGSHNEIPGDDFDAIIGANYPKCAECGKHIWDNSFSYKTESGGNICKDCFHGFPFKALKED